MNRFALTTLVLIFSMESADICWSAPQDELAKAFLETKAKAEAGDIDAQYLLAKLYSTGKGTPKNEAVGVKWFRRVAEQNDARGQSMLGVMYTNARGVERDYDQAIQWFRKAAAQNSAHAKYNLGYMYAVGKGVERDQVQSSHWYREAALLNDAGSQRILGSRYAAGQGVKKDLVKAYAWTQVVLPRGGAAAKKQIDDIQSQMTADQISAGKKMAKEISAQLAMPSKK